MPPAEPAAQAVAGEETCRNSCRCRQLNCFHTDFAFVAVEHYDSKKVLVLDHHLQETIIDVIGKGSQHVRLVLVP